MIHRVLTLSLLLVMAFSATAVQSAEGADKSDAKAPVLAVFSFGGTITESPAGEDFLFASQSESFKDLIARLKKIESDETVKGVVLMVSDTSLGRSQIEEVRAVFDKIKASGKEIVAYADGISMGSYLLLSDATRISVVPTGDIWINGIYGESPYLRGLLDKLGIVPDYQTCGDYKSAGEIFMRNGPSSPAQENLNWLIDGIFNAYLDQVAKGRKVDVAKVREWIDHGMYSAEGAKKAGIIDEVEYRQDFVAGLKKKYGDEVVFEKKYGKKKGTEIDFSSPMGILKFYGELLSGPKKKESKKPAIAIVYVDGMILPGSGEPSGIPLLAGGMAYSTG
jgi:protease-4